MSRILINIHGEEINFEINRLKWQVAKTKANDKGKVFNQTLSMVAYDVSSRGRLLMMSPFWGGFVRFLQYNF